MWVKYYNPRYQIKTEYHHLKGSATSGVALTFDGKTTWNYDFGIPWASVWTFDPLLDLFVIRLSF